MRWSFDVVGDVVMSIEQAINHCYDTGAQSVLELYLVPHNEAPKETGTYLAHWFLVGSALISFWVESEFYAGKWSPVVSIDEIGEYSVYEWVNIIS
jgi:hypothetical protein